MHYVLLLALLVLMPPSVHAEPSPYAGQETRSIKALSTERIEGLTTGAGLGYALAAELNGWPGPLHALELADRLGLSETQRARIEASREAMLEAAKPLGLALIDAEAALEEIFASGSPDREAVLAATSRIGAIEAQLRAVHLAAHIETTPLLTRHQRMIYARERGYSAHHDGHAPH